MALTSKLRSKSVIGVLAGLLGLGTVGTLLMRNAGNLFHSAAPAEGSQRVNINTATLTELERIPGIGTARAKLIVAGRPYQSVDELIKISGIGPKSLESLRTYMKTEGETEKLR